MTSTVAPTTNRIGWVEEEVEAWLRHRMDDRGLS
jgi:predicted DNA-binding transcriptional regulator AlpA